MATTSEALTHGYTTAFLAGAGMLVIAALIVAAAVNTKQTQRAAAASYKGSAGAAAAPVNAGPANACAA